MCVSFSLALFDMQNQSYHNYMLFPIHSTRYLSHEHNTHSLFNSHPNALTLFWSISGHQSLSHSVFLIDAILSLSLYTLILHSLSLSLSLSLVRWWILRVGVAPSFELFGSDLVEDDDDDWKHLSSWWPESLIVWGVDYGRRATSAFPWKLVRFWPNFCKKCHLTLFF